MKTLTQNPYWKGKVKPYLSYGNLITARPAQVPTPSGDPPGPPQMAGFSPLYLPTGQLSFWWFQVFNRSLIVVHELFLPP